jgi:hypothetical protein
MTKNVMTAIDARQRKSKGFYQRITSKTNSQQLGATVMPKQLILIAPYIAPQKRSSGHFWEP